MQAVGEIPVERWPAAGCDPEEWRMVQAAVAGERPAYDVLVQRHLPTVASVVRRFLGDPDEVADVVQETFVRGYRKLATFRGEASLRSWFIRIAVNAGKRRRMAFWRRRVVVTDAVAELARDPVDPRVLAEAAVLREAVARAVAALPDRLRLPLVLHVFDELTGAEVAAVLGWNESTVWTRIYAAQRELRKQLAAFRE
jgi:RNA polymerase sigma-70 factor (ECF subfamily)